MTLVRIRTVEEFRNKVSKKGSIWVVAYFDLAEDTITGAREKNRSRGM